jgi:L-serine deaminase
VPSPTPTPLTIDGYVVIGHVTVTYSQAQVGASVVGAGGTVLSQVLKFGKSFAQCQANNPELFLATAGAIAGYLSTNASNFASAGADLKTYVGVYLAGGATALEFVGAVLGLLSAADWLALLAALGFTVLTVGSELRCSAIAFAVAQQ